jgi:hypothetical protein
VWNNPTSLTDPSGFCTAAADFADCDWGEGQSILHAAYAAFTDWLGAQSENGTWDTRAYFFHHNGFRNTEGWYWANYADEHQAHRASRGDNSVPNGTRAASAQPAERNESGATTYPYPEQSARAFTPMTSWGASVPELASMRGTTATQDQIDHALLFNRGFIQPDSGEAVSLVPDILAMVLPVGRALRTGSTIFRTGHYASRLEAAGVNVARAEAAVASEVSAIRSSMATNADVVGRMRVDGVLIEYRMRLLPDEAVNVGTIFPVR